MKKIFLASLLLSCNAIFAQNNYNHDKDQTSNNMPPDEVRHSFQKDNPNRNDARWEQNNDQWHATYKDDNNRNVDAYYDHNGNRMETHTELDKKDVPQNVDYRINKRYKTNGNYWATRIDRPNDQPLFRIKYHKGKKDRIIYMDEQGKKRHYKENHY